MRDDQKMTNTVIYLHRKYERRLLETRENEKSVRAGITQDGKSMTFYLPMTLQRWNKFDLPDYSKEQKSKYRTNEQNF